MLALFFVWFAGVVGSFSAFLTVVTIIGVIGSMIGWFAVTIDNDNSREVPKPKTKHSRFMWFIAGFLSLGMFASLLPSQKTTYIMAAAYYGEQMVKSEMGDKIYTILSMKMDEYIKEMVDESASKTSKKSEKKESDK